MKKTNLILPVLTRKNAFRCGVVALALVTMTGCKDDAPGIDGPDSPTASELIDGVTPNIVTDPSTLASRVVNYYTGNPGSRAGKSVFSMPEEPTIPTDAIELTSDNANIENSQVYKITTDNAKWNISNLKGALYVSAKNVTLKVGNAETSAVLYLLSESTVTIEDKGEWDSTVNNFTIYAYAPFATTSGDLKIANAGKVYTDEDLTFKKVNLNASGSEICANALRVKEFKANGNNTVSVEEDITVEGNCEISANAQVNAKCLLVTNTLDIPNTADINIDSYIKAKNININASNGRINMLPGALVRVEEKLYMPNQNTGFNFGEVKGVYGLVEAAVFEGQDQDYSHKPYPDTEYTIDLTNLFNGNVYLDFKKVRGIYHGDEVLPDLEAYPRGNGTEIGTTKISANGCRPAAGGQGEEPDPEDVDIIGGSDAHTHPISATCITAYGNQAFLSWHKRGIGKGSGTNHEHDGISYWGCIEVLTIQADTLAITSYMEINPETVDEAGAYDFNHVIYDDVTNSILTTGDNEKKGGIIGKIALDGTRNFGKYTNDTQVMKVRSLLEGKGVSGNSVVIRPSDRTLLLTTAGGYQTMDYTTDSLFNKTEKLTPKVGPFVETAGSAKHVAINSTYAATIEYTKRAGDLDINYDEDDNTTALPAKITVWPLNDYVFGTPVWSVEVPEFAPIYGKNVIAIDTDNTVFSCQGHKGVALYKNGVEVNRFIAPNKYKGAAANGLCIKGNYLYVAYGAAGVWVLDKNTLEVKAKYTKQGNASANYVSVTDDGYVYVAYGRSGAKVMKFRNL